MGSQSQLVYEHCVGYFFSCSPQYNIRSCLNKSSMFLGWNERVMSNPSNIICSLCICPTCPVHDSYVLIVHPRREPNKNAYQTQDASTVPADRCPLSSISSIPQSGSSLCTGVDPGQCQMELVEQAQTRSFHLALLKYVFAFVWHIPALYKSWCHHTWHIPLPLHSYAARKPGWYRARTVIWNNLGYN